MKEFCRGSIVFSEDQPKIDGIYLITEGEFEVTKKITNKSKIEEQKNLSIQK